MDPETKEDARSLAERLDLQLRAIAQRVLPEYFEIEDRAVDMERAPKRVFRSITDTQRLNYALDYVFLDEREKWLIEEEERLEKKYKEKCAELKSKYLELKTEIGIERSECGEEKKRLREGIRYTVIQENAIPLDVQKASAPTNLISSSKELQ